eukprot:c32314_g1_i1.p1 GENE.c32314_g1_i1~~c32314_g1_i1.p1  ORF type:complete len:283 (+),score=61.23 c32314_g1_i1:29-877(+)
MHKLLALVAFACVCAPVLSQVQDEAILAAEQGLKLLDKARQPKAFRLPPGTKTSFDLSAEDMNWAPKSFNDGHMVQSKPAVAPKPQVRNLIAGVSGSKLRLDVKGYPVYPETPKVQPVATQPLTVEQDAKGYPVYPEAPKMETQPIVMASYLPPSTQPLAATPEVTKPVRIPETIAFPQEKPNKFIENSFKASRPPGADGPHISEIPTIPDNQFNPLLSAEEIGVKPTLKLKAPERKSELDSNDVILPTHEEHPFMVPSPEDLKELHMETPDELNKPQSGSL